MAVVLDTYPTSAYDPQGFFDVKALVPYVDQLFVMAYDMQDPDIASATAPLDQRLFERRPDPRRVRLGGAGHPIVLGIPLYGIRLSDHEPLRRRRDDGRPGRRSPTSR